MSRTAAPSAPPGIDPLPRGSVILCSRNRPDLLLETVRSILGGDEVPAELVVVDQSDAPHPVLSAPGAPGDGRVRYLHTRETGLSRANNAGVRAARHDMLVFTHDDVLVSPGWYGSLVRALVAAGERAVVTGRVLPTAPHAEGGFAPSLETRETPAVYSGRLRVGVIHPLNLALRRSALEEVGGFDERLGPGTPYPAAEDNDLSFRLLEAGYRVVYTPEALLYHQAWRARSEYVGIRWSYGRGQGAYYAKHLSLRDPHVLGCLGNEFVRRTLRAPVRFLSEPERARGDLAYAAGLVSGLCGWLLRERVRGTSR